jgi:hypothetical protein
VRQGAGVDTLLPVFDALLSKHEGKDPNLFNDDTAYKSWLNQVRVVVCCEGLAGARRKPA